MANPMWERTSAVIELAETLMTFASDLVEAVMFISERDLTLNHLTTADRQELIRVLTVAAKLKRIAEQRSELL